MAFNKNDKADGAKVRRSGGMRRRKKVCVFCGEKNGVIDYKDTNKLVDAFFYRNRESFPENSLPKYPNLTDIV